MALKAAVVAIVAAMGTFALDVRAFPYLSGSKIVVGAHGYDRPYSLEVLGGGRIDGTTYVAPNVSRPTRVSLIAAGQGAIARVDIRVVPAPGLRDALVAVASYGDGLVFHDPTTLRVRGLQPINGAAGDVAFARSGNVYAPDTDGNTLTALTRRPWQLHTFSGVPLGNEVAVDNAAGYVFVTNRDVAQKGALTRIAADGTIARLVTGVTAEGLAIDERRGIVYVGNVNDGTVLAVDAATMQARRRIPALRRTFGIALDASANRLFVVSNSSRSMPGGAGGVGAIDLRRRGAPIVARSASFAFPLGVALDSAAHHLFVTDEGVDRVYVLDEASLQRRHTPLQTCHTPWRPKVDSRRKRLYVPCAGSNQLDVFDTRTLRRIAGAPFKTGAFPLAVAAWN